MLIAANIKTPPLPMHLPPPATLPPTRDIQLMIKIIVGIILIVGAFCDGIRDGDYNIGRKVSWWQWHIAKWLAYFPIRIYAVYLVFSIYWWPLLALVCLYAFRIGRKVKLSKLQRD